jgi:tyrosyl-tRNA synthetase
MYGKVMSIPDSAMLNYFTLVTRFGPDEIAAVERGLADGTLDPMEAKMRLAREIVSIYHGDEASAQAEGRFRQVFQDRELPPEADMAVYRLQAETNIVDLLVNAELASTKSQARRLVQQGGVRLDGKAITIIEHVVSPSQAGILQVGKRRFVRLARASGAGDL